VKRLAHASARNVDRQRAENEARAKVAEAFGDEQFEIDQVTSAWYPRAAEWSVHVSGVSAKEENSQ